MKTDADLLRETAAGDPYAFGELYRRYKLELCSYAKAVLQDDQLAEDILHDAFLRLHSAGHTVRNPTLLRQWLYTVVRRLSYDVLRRKHSVDPLDHEAPSGEPSPLDLVERTTTEEALQEAIRRLPAPFREVIFLREYMQLSYEEMCDIMGVTLPAIKSRLFRAREALAASLITYFHE